MPNKTNRFVNGALYAIVAILFILIALSGTLLSIQLKDYIKIDEKEVQLTSNSETEFDIFSVHYENASGEITVSGADGKKVVAPGTSVEYTIYLRNADEIAIDYVMVPKIKYTSEYSVPVFIRMLNEEGNYVIGDAKTWLAVEDISELSISKTLVKDESAEYYFQWKWEYESGNDEYDTLLGASSKEQNIGLEAKFAVYAEANTEIGANGGVVKSGLGNIIAAGAAFVLLCAASVLATIILVKKRKNEII